MHAEAVHACADVPEAGCQSLLLMACPRQAASACSAYSACHANALLAQETLPTLPPGYNRPLLQGLHTSPCMRSATCSASACGLQSHQFPFISQRAFIKQAGYQVADLSLPSTCLSRESSGYPSLAGTGRLHPLQAELLHRCRPTALTSHWLSHPGPSPASPPSALRPSPSNPLSSPRGPLVSLTPRHGVTRVRPHPPDLGPHCCTSRRLTLPSLASPPSATQVSGGAGR